ncbi:tyrosine-protein kinase Mer isoform X2 [Osmerus mordax]|uniref:tyrosine-protein kinase Mer isoform X2 n=1 Tax=Osmerus mordax TaxID=8014 RepID=UPI0035107782
MTILWLILSVRCTVLLSWLYIVYSIAQETSEEVELFNSMKLDKPGWKSNPSAAWTEITYQVGSESAPMYQACTTARSRSLLTKWIDKKDAHRLLLDITFAQEEEPLNQSSPLQIHMLETTQALSGFQSGRNVLSLVTSKAFPDTLEPKHLPEYFDRRVGLNLGQLSQRGFYLRFSFSGNCVFIASVRLYYKRCPGFVHDLVRFEGASAASGPQTGVCVEGAVKEAPCERHCQEDGVWGPLEGGCICPPGHQRVGATCQACGAGYHKPTNESGECRLCPPNSSTTRAGAVECVCDQGYIRLPSDPYNMGCTRSPSAPVNVTVQRLKNSTLSLRWGPPHDTGGRQEVMYDVHCQEREGDTNGLWKKCVDSSLSASTRLTTTEVNLTVFPEVKVTGDPRPLEHQQEDLSTWGIVGGLVGGLLLLALVLTAVCTLRRKNIQHRQDPVFLPLHSGVTYRRDEDVHLDLPEPTTREPEAVQFLESVSDRLLTSLKDSVVHRNKLTLGKELGKGEFGTVYEGLFSPEEGINIKVAVKTMKVGIYSQDDLEEFLKEAEIMKHFDHENVVKLLGVTLEREQDSPLPVPLVILPFMKHGDLRRFLVATRFGAIPMVIHTHARAHAHTHSLSLTFAKTHGRYIVIVKVNLDIDLSCSPQFVPYQSLLRFMIDIAAGMEYLSSHGLLHRDLAARNCMLGDDLHVCVADFGLSKNIYSNNYYRQKVAVRMPVKWMALESLSESIYTSKSDVWSFGVTMWEIVSRGRTPYPGIHNHELLEYLEAEHRLKQPDCDAKLYEVMQSCWQRDVTLRPGFRELGERLKVLLCALPVLEACQEAHYINQGLEAACQGGAQGDNPNLDDAARGNVYLPTPTSAKVLLNEEKKKNTEEEGEDGYLLQTGQAVKKGE